MKKTFDWFFIGTTTIEKGGGLIAVTGIMQTIAVIPNNFASWTIMVVMHIITLKNGALIVDCSRMMMSKTMMAGIRKQWVGQTNMVLPSLLGTSCKVEQWWQKAYTLNIQFEHQLLCPLLQSILNMYWHTSQKCWEWQLDYLDNKQDMWEAIAIKWMNQSKWPTYYSSHYCIDAMKQYNCIAKIKITLYCNMANKSLFARCCCIIIRMTIDHWCCLITFNVLII